MTIKLNPKTLVSAKLYNATLAYVNRVRKTRKAPALQELPIGGDGIEGCSLGLALEGANKAFTPDGDYYERKVPVRVMQLKGKFRVRLHTKTGKPEVLTPPKSVQEFLKTYDEAIK